MSQEIESEDAMAKSCEMSLNIQQMLENKSAGIHEEFLKFYQFSKDTLQHQKETVDLIEKEKFKLSDRVKKSKKLLEDTTHQINSLSEQLAKTDKEISEAKEETILIRSQAAQKASFIQRSDFLPLIPSLFQSIDLFKQDIADVKKSIAQYEEQFSKNEEELNHFLNVSPNMGQETSDNLISRIKKNQNKAVELETKIKKLSQNIHEDEVYDESPSQNMSPSTIIHRTQDSESDYVRKLKSQMEEAINRNTRTKMEINSLNQDYQAMREENQMLKMIIRTTPK